MGDVVLGFDISFLYDKRGYPKKLGSGKQRVRLNSITVKRTWFYFVTTEPHI